jgi:type III restriction enzyme
MQIQLEQLDYQKQAIDSVLEVMSGQSRNTFANSVFFDIHTNFCDLTDEEIKHNKLAILERNGLTEEKAVLTDERQLCIEMETGTGKTLVYIRTLYELHQRFGYTKFIIIVPSIAIKEGIISTLKTFGGALKTLYDNEIPWFEYDSSRLSPLRHFIHDDQPQIMVTTIQSFTAEDRILNQHGRDDSIEGMSYLQALGKTQPIIVMDEPQEGMDTELAKQRLHTLNPLWTLRYSATHKEVKNRLYRLTPFDAYQHGMVKKIEVLSVAEKNDEATLKIEIADIQAQQGQNPKVKLNLWCNTAQGYKFKASHWLKIGDNLAEKSGNVSYADYTIDRIHKGLRDANWKVKFDNGIELVQGDRQGDFTGLFRTQLEWLILTHFEKRERLKARGIKCLSLIFIDKVDNYIGEEPLIKRLFEEQYAKVHREKMGEEINAAQIEAIQGYYFARTGKGDFTDNESSMRKNKEIYDLILRDKTQLLDMNNPVEFIFSHSALGVGWDNPNVFNIATLNMTYSEVKKRQEIGRGLRICVNQQGQRVYDPPGNQVEDEVNLLTVIPNETYETFVAQYQEQIREDYEGMDAGAKIRHNPKGKAKPNVIKRNQSLFETDAFRNFWKALAKKTSYTVTIDEQAVVRDAAIALNKIHVPKYEAEIVKTRIHALYEDSVNDEEIGRETERLKGQFSPLDLIEELSELTALSYRALFELVKKLENIDQLVRNPPQYLHQAVKQIRAIELDEMLRTLSYEVTGEYEDGLEQFKEQIETFAPVEPTPHKGIYDHAICDADSSPERNFARSADVSNRVEFFLKLPDFYKIPIPALGGSTYTPDFGIVIKQSSLKEGAQSEWRFVIETKSTNDLEDRKALTNDERFRIQCAIKHFEALGLKARADGIAEEAPNYLAPAKDFHRLEQEIDKLNG